MEEMNSDQVFEIPDTPERAASRSQNGAQFGKESNSLVPSHQRKSGLMNGKSLNPLLASRGRVPSENGLSRRPHLCPQRSPINLDEYCPQSNSPLENSHLHHNAPLFRRPAIVNNSKPEKRHSKGAQLVEKWKAGRATNSSKKSLRIKDDDLLDLTEMTEPDRILDIVFPRGASKDLQAKEMREGRLSSIGGSSLQLTPLSSRISSSTSKGKEKIGVNTCNGSGSTSNIKKGIDTAVGHRHKIEKQLPECHLSVTSPRVAGQKRLVRNGCISPLNIVTRAPKLAESPQDGCKELKENGAPTLSTSKEHVANMANVSTRTSVINKEASSEARDGRRDTLLGGWRSTHRRSRTEDQPLSYMDQHILGRDDDARCFTNEQHSDILVERDNCSGGKLHHVGNVAAKRRRTHGLTSRNQGECSTVVPDDSEILFLGSSQESSSSSDPQVIGSRSNEESDVRAGQVEADEMFACELQERLYHEESIFGGAEMDESIAWALQQEEDALPSASGQIHPAPLLVSVLL
ncbi:hypothetical protein OIU77_022566 [Salix suchowensis]|uniref:Uncharacterized protein n=1 Tax=Salix suchowensis TaxID=1278906 RepID=A0ABQ9C0S9_9ROSI|nr:hypothetical protein OIU77_022566 [Salix suchowensis]